MIGEGARGDEAGGGVRLLRAVEVGNLAGGLSSTEAAGGRKFFFRFSVFALSLEHARQGVVESGGIGCEGDGFCEL
jgi:hypothetical protein